MNKIIRKIGITAIILVSTIGVLGAAPVQGAPVAVPTAEIRDIGQVFNLLGTISGWLFRFFFAIAVLFLLWGAFEYLTKSTGDKAEGGKKTIKFALIAIIIAIVAGSIPMFLQSILMLR